MKRYIKSAEIAPYADLPKKLLSDEQKAMRKKTRKVNEEIAYDMLENLSDTKKVQLDKFLSRNEALTSTYGCSFGNIRVYKEGWYLTLDGTRSQFSVWCYDNDGELVEGRKPNENKLSFLYEQDLKFNGVDWYKMAEGASNVTSATDPATGWPDSDWWLSIDRPDDPDVDDLLADPEERVLQEAGITLGEYAGEMILRDARDNYDLFSMDWNDYVDQELQLASTCRSAKEFEGKYRKWMDELQDREG